VKFGISLLKKGSDLLRRKFENVHKLPSFKNPALISIELFEEAVCSSVSRVFNQCSHIASNRFYVNFSWHLRSKKSCLVQKLLLYKLRTCHHILVRAIHVCRSLVKASRLHKISCTSKLKLARSIRAGVVQHLGWCGLLSISIDSERLCIPSLISGLLKLLATLRWWVPKLIELHIIWCKSSLILAESVAAARIEFLLASLWL